MFARPDGNDISIINKAWKPDVDQASKWGRARWSSDYLEDNRARGWAFVEESTKKSFLTNHDQESDMMQVLT